MAAAVAPRSQRPRLRGCGPRGSCEGRLLYQTGHGTRGLVVAYVHGMNRVTLHLPSYNEAVNYLDGQHVVLEPLLPGAGVSSAPIEGEAVVVDDEAVPQAEAAQLEQYPPGSGARYVVIQPDAAGAGLERDEP